MEAHHPSEAELAQPYYCTEAGVFYAQQHFSTARTDKESYLLFYTLRGAGLIEQGKAMWYSAPGRRCC